mmetsp:Transcript_4634/g.10055  ORF Transcript_4634/g.10055 Transcript_4634/m.10055 type:complete len:202 (-) Transcript_4634:478-1083(-)
MTRWPVAGPPAIAALGWPATTPTRSTSRPSKATAVFCQPTAIIIGHVPTYIVVFRCARRVPLASPRATTSHLEARIRVGWPSTPVVRTSSSRLLVPSTRALSASSGVTIVTGEPVSTRPSTSQRRAASECEPKVAGTNGSSPADTRRIIRGIDTEVPNEWPSLKVCVCSHKLAVDQSNTAAWKVRRQSMPRMPSTPSGSRC